MTARSRTEKRSGPLAPLAPDGSRTEKRSGPLASLAPDGSRTEKRSGPLASLAPDRSPRGGLLKPARRPPGWLAPGPPPRPPGDASALMPAEGEDLCWLAGDWRILQRTDGHRFSLDDLVTAFTAAAQCTAAPPARVLDLGCGIGSVLLWLAWRFPAARVIGIEAQELSASLARRSIAINGAEDRCEVRLGDFREPAAVEGLAPFDLVTGTPPYFRRGAGLESDRAQKAPARFEHRGGPEAYAIAAAHVLKPGAPLVLCASITQVDRLPHAAAAAGLALERRRDVIPRSGKPPLLSMFVLRHPAHAAPFEASPPLTVRDEAGRRTPDFIAVRAAMGMPP